ncbi:hypothetical protein DM02DRAFT_612826 [Periconia macrospinosa]|uniref:Zn(2)-C6 fungal-type domain-containing protein n=1 Tax=Periconia macrospinosa TaxID=97972 RepID=A0A2V1DWP2_9PLEO|nr:hypothetical protein DM02DRAFT_612826 [Periconia macrospinosa]
MHQPPEDRGMGTPHASKAHPNGLTMLRPLIPKPIENLGVTDSGAQQRKTRASNPKVRTGCKTCKIRRLKCDETRPVCQRCEKARVACDGYSSTNQHPLVAKSKPNTVPASTFAPNSKATRRRILPHPSPGSTPSVSRFIGDEVSHFDFFRHQLTMDFSGYSCSDLWSRVVLCEAMTNDCVRHAVLAVAALSQGISISLESSLKSNKPSALSPWTSKSIVNSHHQAALRHYVRALSMFRMEVHVAAEIHSPRAVFIMTYLLITFELLQGNMEMVDRLLNSSIQLLKGSLKQHRQHAQLQHNGTRRRAEDDVDDIEHILSFLSIMGAVTPFLKRQQANLALWDTTAIDDVPDLEPRSTKQLQTCWGRFFSRTLAFTGQAFAIAAETRTAEIELTLVRKQDAYLSHLDKWRQVLDVGLARAIITSDNRAKMAIQLMQLHHLMISIVVKCCLDHTDMIWDEYDHDFFVLVERCLAFAAETKPGYHALFTLSMGVLSTLGPAIAKCRNHNIRMKALEIARRMPWREGTWDAEAEIYGRIGAVLLEERGRNRDGFISPENRWTWVEGDWNLERNTLIGKYVRSIPDRTGNPVLTSLEVGLDAWYDVCADICCPVDHAAGCGILNNIS